MDYNICVLSPPGNPFNGTFDELAELIGYGLEDLGYGVKVAKNAIDAKSRNILIGCHLMGESGVIPSDSIIINTEPIFCGLEKWDKRIMYWASRYETWDYSRLNIAEFARRGVKAKLLTLGHHEKMRRITPADVEIGVLFYGHCTKRRKDIMVKLRKAGCDPAVVSGCYGAERDFFIARSKMVVNIHHEKVHGFESVRCTYLMSNSVPIASEINPDTDIDERYREGICGVPYDGLVDACRELIGDDKKRAELGERGYETIKKLPQAEIMRELIA